MEYIHIEKFICTLNENYKELIVKQLEDNIEIEITSSEELNPSSLSSHKIRLKPDVRPIKIL